MQQKPKQIIFDFGGVLLDWHPDRVYRPYFRDDAAMQRFYEETQILWHNRELDRGMPFDKVLKTLTQEFPQYSTPLQLWKTSWHKMLGGPIEGSIRVLYALKRKGYRLFGLTNWAAETFPYVYYTYEFFHVFEDIVVSGREGLIKPEPEIFHLCLERNQILAADSIFIDDNADNVRVSRELGMQAIHFRDAEALKAELEAMLQHQL